MAESGTLGYPRIGAKRELKRALEAYWKGKSSQEELFATAAELRLENWKSQRAAGITRIPSNDFSLYDHVLDTAFLVGAIPDRFDEGDNPLDLYFAMARGTKEARAMEMTKWFNTNYHYIVPEIDHNTRFHLNDDKPLRHYLEAKDAAIETRPVILGPVTFLSLAKSRDPDQAPLSRLQHLLPVYAELLHALADAGADWIQVDEPILSTDLSDAQEEAFRAAYRELEDVRRPKILLATYFGPVEKNIAVLEKLPVEGLHFDLLRGGEDLPSILDAFDRRETTISLGVVDGRNVWKNDLPRTAGLVEEVAERLGPDRVEVAPSCSLLHAPVDLSYEETLKPEIREWLAFARQKLDEIVALARVASGERERSQELIDEHKVALENRRRSPETTDPTIRRRVDSVTEDMTRRKSAYATRQRKQQAKLGLPRYPTTTIGSFPQTPEIRRARAAFRKGELGEREYRAFIEGEIRATVAFQDEAGLDLLVHGEPERNDMVEYFGEQFTGFTGTDNGWVQSYGSRCVKPPIIYGDLGRPRPMTVEWTTFAQSLTEKPMKGMLTGPVTILHWSFVRDDQPEEVTATQIALAIRDEVEDLEGAGISVIQIDEPAFREGLPLRRSGWPDYLEWAVHAFRLATTGVSDETQIHTHMCYSEFNDIIDSIAALDADVISIETSRSDMELLDAFTAFKYPNGIGPGVYDIHSPRVPTVEEMEELLRKALEVIEPEQLWVNPDCGLKTRRWEEVKPALRNMVSAARRLREK